MSNFHPFSGDHRLLLIRLSAFGDVVQSFYVLSDIRRAHPDIKIDWCVDDRFASLAALHPAIERIISLPTRRWKRFVSRPKLWPEMLQLVHDLRLRRFDLTLDLQGMHKSAVIGWMSHALCRAGPAPISISESGAHFFYTRKILISRAEGLASRARQFAGEALNYRSTDYVLDSGIRCWQRGSQTGEVFFILGASRPEKSWNNAAWALLGRRLIRKFGFKIHLLWGSEAEKASAIELERAVDSTNLRIADKVYLVDSLKIHFSSACFVVGGDTGLTHLAAAIGSPTLMLFFVTRSLRYTHSELTNLEFLDAAHSPVTVEAVEKKIDVLLGKFH